METEKQKIYHDPVVTDRKGEAAVPDIQKWANKIARSLDEKVEASVYFDGDSSTYVVRLAKGSRVLVFRYSEAQVQTPERESECEKILRSKLQYLSG